MTVSGGQQGDSAIHILRSILPQIPFLSRLPHNTEQSSLCYTVDSWLLTLNIAVCICVRAQSLQSCPAFCDPMDCSLPGSSVHGILQAGILEWVVMPSSRESSQPRDQTHNSYISCIGRWVLYHYRNLGSLTVCTCHLKLPIYPRKGDFERG